MSIQTNLITTLKTGTTGVGVFSGEIPESEPLPAVALYNVGPDFQRTLAGEKTKNMDVWRLTVVDELKNLQNTIDQILLLDNTKNEFFQRLYFNLINREPKALSEPHARAIIEIQAYPI